MPPFRVCLNGNQKVTTNVFLAGMVECNFIKTKNFSIQFYRCVARISATRWRNNFEFWEGITVYEAEQLAREGKDNGSRGVWMLRPEDTNDVDRMVEWEGYLALMYSLSPNPSIRYKNPLPF